METKNEILAAALRHTDRGLMVIPVGEGKDGKFKTPLVSWKKLQSQRLSREQVQTMFEQPNVKGIAVVMGNESGLLALDVEKDGLDQLKDLEMPDTACSRTGGGGKHFFFKRPDVPMRDKIRFSENMDVRTEGLIILPPSLHHSGGKYEWEHDLDTPIADVPQWLLDKLTDKPQYADKPSNNAKPVSRKIREGSRNQTLTSVAGSLRHRGMSESTIHEILHVVNSKECEVPLSDDEVRGVAKSVGRYDPGQSGRSPVVINLEDVKRESVEWLWQNRIPSNKVSIIEGDPDVGKSFLTLQIACNVTLGKPLPGDQGDYEPAKVLLLTAEDGVADTIKPRLEDMGADVKRVRQLAGVKDKEGNEQHFSLKNDLSMVEQVLADDGGYKLLIIDPLNAYMGGVDTHKDSDVRTVLTPLKTLAERHGIAIICVRHLTKSPRENAKHRGQGSIGFIGAARTAYLVGINPRNKSQSVIACVKNNIAKKLPALAFEITQSGKFEWKGEVPNLDADALLGAQTKDGDGDKSAVDEAKAILHEILAGGPKPIKQAMKEAKDAGIAPRTLRRAREEMNIPWSTENNQRVWTLPTQDNMANGTQDALWPTSLFDLPEADKPKLSNEHDKSTLDNVEPSDASKNAEHQSDHAANEIDPEDYDPYEVAGVTADDAKALPEPPADVPAEPVPVVPQPENHAPKTTMNGIRVDTQMTAFQQIMQRKPKPQTAK